MSDFDQDEYNEKLSEFAGLSEIGEVGARNMELAFEELIKNNIAVFIQHNDDRGLPIEVSVEHVGTVSEVEMTITYGGERYDPIYDGDELSALMAKKLFKSIKYHYDDINRIVIKF